jgi:hypothetical protein
LVHLLTPHYKSIYNCQINEEIKEAVPALHWFPTNRVNHNDQHHPRSYCTQQLSEQNIGLVFHSTVAVSLGLWKVDKTVPGLLSCHLTAAMQLSVWYINSPLSSSTSQVAAPFY